MAKKSGRSGADIVGQVAPINTEDPEASGKVVRSKRGFAKGVKSVQICFKVEEQVKDAIKMYALVNKMEIGEVFDELISESNKFDEFLK